MKVVNRLSLGILWLNPIDWVMIHKKYCPSSGEVVRISLPDCPLSEVSNFIENIYAMLASEDREVDTKKYR